MRILMAALALLGAAIGFGLVHWFGLPEGQVYQQASPNTAQGSAVSTALLVPGSLAASRPAGPKEVVVKDMSGTGARRVVSLRRCDLGFHLANSTVCSPFGVAPP